MDQQEYLKIIASGEEALASAREQSEHPFMERFGGLLRALAAREDMDCSQLLRAEQIQTQLFTKRILPMVKPGSFLELGCGFDPLLLADEKIQRKAFMDLFYTGLQEARKELIAAGLLGKSILLQGDLNQPLPFKSNSLDNLFMVNTSGAIKDYHSFSREIWRVLSPGGKFFICGDAESNALPGSSGSYYLHNRLLTHEILKLLKGDFFSRIYVAGPALPLRAAGEYRLASERGTPFPDDLARSGEFVLQEATARMLKFSSGREVRNNNGYLELTEADTGSGRKYFVAYMRIVVAEKRLAGRGWNNLTEVERDYVREKLRPSPVEQDLLRQREELSRKNSGRDAEALQEHLKKLREEGPSMDIFSLKRTFPQVFSSKNKKIRNPLKECIHWLEREVEKALAEGPDDRAKKFQNRTEVRRALEKAGFFEKPLEETADRLMKELGL